MQTSLCDDSQRVISSAQNDPINFDYIVARYFNRHAGDAYLVIISKWLYLPACPNQKVIGQPFLYQKQDLHFYKIWQPLNSKKREGKKHPFLLPHLKEIEPIFATLLFKCVQCCQQGCYSWHSSRRLPFTDGFFLGKTAPDPRWYISKLHYNILIQLIWMFMAWLIPFKIMI